MLLHFVDYLPFCLVVAVQHLGMAFHITDLVQRGDALLLATGAGPLVRLRRDTFV